MVQSEVGIPEAITNAQDLLDNKRYEEAQTKAREAIECDEVTNNHHWHAQACFILGLATQELGDDHEAREHFELASRYAQEVNDEVLALRCQLGLARCDHRSGDLATALHAASQVLATARERELRDLEATALSTIGNIAWKRGDLAAAQGDLERAASLFDQLGNKIQALRARVALGYVHALQGNLSGGRTLMEKGVIGLIEAGEYPAAAKALCNLAFVHYAKGELAEARDLLLRSTELDERHNNRQISLAAWYNLGLIELAQDWRAAALHSFTRSYALAKDTGDRTVANMSLLYTGSLALLSNQPREALNYFQLGHDNFTGLEVQERRLATYFLAIGFTALDEEEAGRELWDTRVPLAQLRGCEDDLDLLVRLLQQILTPDYIEQYKLSSQTQFTAGRWLDTLKHEISELRQ